MGTGQGCMYASRGPGGLFVRKGTLGGPRSNLKCFRLSASSSMGPGATARVAPSQWARRGPRVPSSFTPARAGGRCATPGPQLPSTRRAWRLPAALK